MTRWDTDNLNAAHTQRELDQEWGGGGVSDLVKRLREGIVTKMVPDGEYNGEPDWDSTGGVMDEAADRIDQIERELALQNRLMQDAHDGWKIATDQLAAEKALADGLYEAWECGECFNGSSAPHAYRKARGL